MRHLPAAFLLICTSGGALAADSDWNKPYDSNGIVRSMTALKISATETAVPAASTPKQIRLEAAEGKDLNAIFSDDRGRLWVSGDEGFLGRSDDGGETWTKQPIASSSAVNDGCFSSASRGLLVAGGSILTTNNAGQNWNQTSPIRAEDLAGAAADMYSVRFPTQREGWIVGAISRGDRVVDGLILSTNDAGQTWKRQNSPSRSELVHLDFVDASRGWIVGGDGTILRTSDGGRSWTALRSGTNETLNHVVFQDARQGWAVGAHGTILKTTDAGDTWTAIESKVKTSLTSIGFSGEKGWIIGRAGTILQSSDGGGTWTLSPTGSKSHFFGLLVLDDGVWAAGSDATILRIGPP